MDAKKLGVYVKIETVAGTYLAPIAADLMPVKDVQDRWSPEYTDLGIEVPYKGNRPQIAVSSQMQVDFSVPMYYAGTPLGTPPLYGRLFRMCESVETVTATTDVQYDPTDGTAGKSGSIAIQRDGLLHKVSGARGSFGYRLAEKQVPEWSFSMVGTLFEKPATVADIGGSVSSLATPLPVRQINTTATLFGYAACIKSIEFNQNNVLATRDLINCSGTLVPDRAERGRIVAEMVPPATFDFWDKFYNNLTGALTWQHGQVAGQIIKVDHPKIQLINPTYDRADGLLTVSADFIVFPNAGVDQTKLTFK